MSYITPVSKRKGLQLFGSPNELFLIAAIVVLSLVIGLNNSVFFSIATPFDLLRSSLIEILFALGLLIVLVSGGIDISFPQQDLNIRSVPAEWHAPPEPPATS